MPAATSEGIKMRPGAKIIGKYGGRIEQNTVICAID
jgi:hypothetical protein